MFSSRFFLSCLAGLLFWTANADENTISWSASEPEEQLLIQVDRGEIISYQFQEASWWIKDMTFSLHRNAETIVAPEENGIDLTPKRSSYEMATGSAGGSIRYQIQNEDDTAAMIGIDLETLPPGIAKHERHIFWSRNNGVWIIDAVQVKESGTFDFFRSWNSAGGLNIESLPGGSFETRNSGKPVFVLLASGAGFSQFGDTIKPEKAFFWQQNLQAGETVYLPVFIKAYPHDNDRMPWLLPWKHNVFITFDGEQRSLIAIGPAAMAQHVFDTEATFISENATLNAAGQSFDMIELYSDLFNLPLPEAEAAEEKLARIKADAERSRW